MGPLHNYANPMFASRPSMLEAMNFASVLIETIEGAEKAAAYTALYVVINTAAAEEDKNLKNIAINQNEVMNLIDKLRYKIENLTEEVGE